MSILQHLLAVLLQVAPDSAAPQASPYDELLERAYQAPIVAIGRALQVQTPWLQPTRPEAVLAIEHVIAGAWNTSWTVRWPADSPQGSRDAPLIFFAGPSLDEPGIVWVRVQATDTLAPPDRERLLSRLDALADILDMATLADRDRAAVGWLVEQSTDPVSRPAALRTLGTFVWLPPEGGGFPTSLATLLTADHVDRLVDVLCNAGISLQEASWLCAALEGVSAVHPRLAEGVLRQLAARGEATDWKLLDPLVLALGRNTQSPVLRELVNRIRWTGPDPFGIESEGSQQERVRLLDALVTEAQRESHRTR